MNLKHGDVTEAIIGAAFEVYRVLGYGFLEKVYQRALHMELQQRGLEAELEYPIQVNFKGMIVGDYYADLFVEHKVIVEVKVARAYNSKDEAQLLNELKATGIEVGLLINFGANRVEFKRLIFSERSAFDPRESAADRQTVALREDEEDLSAFDERAGEPTLTYEELLRDLKAHGKI